MTMRYVTFSSSLDYSYKAIIYYSYNNYVTGYEKTCGAITKSYRTANHNGAWTTSSIHEVTSIQVDSKMQVCKKMAI